MCCHSSDKNGKNRKNKGHNHSIFMMIICFLPLVILIYNLMVSNNTLTGTLSWFNLVYLLCPLMFVFMIFSMRSGHHRHSDDCYDERE